MLEKSVVPQRSWHSSEMQRRIFKNIHRWIGLIQHRFY